MKLSVLAIVVSLLLVLSTAALAGAPNDLAVREAQARFEEGKRLYREGHNYDGARLKFLQAYAVTRSAEILWNLAVSEFDSGNLEDAVNHLRAYELDPKGKAANKALIGELLRRARRHLVQVEIDAPPGAMITVDGRVIAELAPLQQPLDLRAGAHAIDVRYAGVTKSAVIVVSDESGPQKETFEFGTATEAKHAAPSPSEKVSAEFVPNSGAMFAIDPLAKSAAHPEVAGLSSEKSKSVARIAVPLSLGLGGAVALAVGVAFASQSQEGHVNLNSRRAEIEGICTDMSSEMCLEFRAIRARQQRDAVIATASYVAAGGLALAALGVWWFWPKESKNHLSIAPTIAPGILRADVAFSF